MNRKHKKDTIDLDINEAIKIKDRIINISEKLSSEKDKKDLIAASHLLELVITLYSAWSNSKKKMNKILKMFFGNRSEKSSVITKEIDDDVEIGNNDSKGDDKNDPLALCGNPKGIINDNDVNDNGASDGAGNKTQDEKEGSGKTGRNPASDYTGANEITCSLDHNHRPGVLCPKCKRNKLYEIAPKETIRLVGHAPVSAFKFIMQKSRCICGSIFTAMPPLEFEDLYNGDKYSPSALSSMVIYKYLLGSSFGSVEKIQSMAGIPLPSSTQANKIRDMIVPVFESIVEVLKYLAANAYALGFDDTTIKLLTEKRLTKRETLTNKGHGTAVVANDFDLSSGLLSGSSENTNTIILYDFDYNKHAGDVMMNLLSLRERSDLPLLISDGLVSYDQCKKEGVDVNCNAHARRKMVEEDPSLESYVGQIIINCYKEIYKNEKHCKLNNIQKEKRMEYHVENSSHYFSKITAVFELVKGDISQEEKVLSIKAFELKEPVFPSEPNDDLYKAANYFLNRKESLTAVLSISGAPLDTNYVERVIKSIIKIRRNSQFFENLESAKYSGNILTLLETTNFNKINAFLYTEFLLENKDEVMKKPRNFLPWIYDKSDSEKESYWKGVDQVIHGNCGGVSNSTKNSDNSNHGKKDCHDETKSRINPISSQPPSSSSEYQSSSQSRSYKLSELRGSG